MQVGERVSIHYNGPISWTPGETACHVVSPQATAADWNAVDCDRCKTLGLLDLPLEHSTTVGTQAPYAPPGPPMRYTVAAVEPYRLGLAGGSDEGEAEPLAWRPLSDFDDRDAWRVAA